MEAGECATGCGLQLRVGDSDKLRMKVELSLYVSGLIKELKRPKKKNKAIEGQSCDLRPKIE